MEALHGERVDKPVGGRSYAVHQLRMRPVGHEVPSTKVRVTQVETY